MKKIISVFLVCLLLLCIAACGSTDRSHANFGNTIKFSSSEEMLKYMNGMWVLDENTDTKSYYIFQDGQVHIVTDATYSAQVKKALDSALQNGGLDTLYMQDFENVSGRMYLSDISITPDPVTLFPQDGEIKLYDGKYDEQSIVITEESVLLVPKGADSGTAMTKLSNTADFSAEHFETLFNQAIDSYQISSGYFLMDTAEYGEMIKTTIPQFDWWSQTWSDDDLEVYAPDEALTPVAGSSLLISKESLTFVYKVSVSTGFIGKNHTQSLVITYSPEEGSIQVLETNNPSMNLYSLIKYGLYAIQNIPEAYTDPIELANDMDAKGRKVSSDYSSEIVMTANGITYELSTTEAGSATLGEFNIKLNKTISLNTILEGAMESTETETAPTQSGTMKQLLDSSKSWIGEWEYDGWEYNIHFVFTEDGACYFALTSETELFGAGIGTYAVKDENKLSVKIMMDGKEKTATYNFNPEDFSLTVTSKEGLVAEKGDVFCLREDPDNDVAQVRQWGELLADGADENDLWGV